ncbi:hypothetical protein [Streptacidiphilus anmyonensis]|nr:hypothetical protein [Streptacidiphilus anmyonensis]
MFFAHDIATWIGLPTGLVMAAMFVLRKHAKDLHGSRRQSRQSGSDTRRD